MRLKKSKRLFSVSLFHPREASKRDTIENRRVFIFSPSLFFTPERLPKRGTIENRRDHSLLPSFHPRSFQTRQSLKIEETLYALLPSPSFHPREPK
ncbi:hypothetical protein AVEN_242722-1 [Araneus ventricosus]|uniref:Uncharacterized protein n=1 Tax=Araneus ventricosus TaxID=182803 RepID=A0A4Y2STM9_ARAVE|nr:hypothetical protein AVEN_242722-1 [Araneus ventricosus]